MSKIEIFLIALFVILSFVSSAVKKWKGTVAPKFPPTIDSDEWEEEPLPQEIAEPSTVFSRLKVEKFAENENYFTHETTVHNYDHITQNRDEFSAKMQLNDVQYIENEEDKNWRFDFNAEELYKGIIYNEILQRPKYL
ncbi:MAG: hypothetical protein LBL18_05335 [Bacteroidales bacterium]|jgi:hypothetical protein|nr:hypothetical protein [Bacteroidales bacterium]